MAAIKTHELITLVSAIDGKKYNFNLGKISKKTATNDVRYVIEGPTSDLYTFGIAHLNELFHINELEGLRVEFAKFTNTYFGYDYIQMKLSVYDGFRRVTGADVEMVGFSTYMSRDRQLDDNFPYVAPGFVWDLANDNLAVLSQKVALVAESGTYRYVGQGFNSDRAMMPGVTDIVDGVLMTRAKWRDDAWKYVFTDYSTLNGNTDKDDEEKQKPTDKKGYPYGPGGPSRPTEGGDMDDPNTPIGLDPITADRTNPFVSLYRCTSAQLSEIANDMLSTDINAQLRKLFNSPFDAIISLRQMPFSAQGVESYVRFAGINSSHQAVKVTQSVYELYCGGLGIKEFFGSFLDYAPYTKISIYLPYCGTYELDTDKIMDNIVTVRYRVDVMTGACIAFVQNRDNIILQVNGNVSYSMPVSNIDYSSLMQTLIGSTVELAGSVASGNVAGIASGAAGMAMSVGMMKPSTNVSGNFGGNTGALANRKPYLIIQRPVLALPDNWEHFNGFAATVTKKLGDCHGFTKVREVHLDHVHATNAEKAELESLLKQGVVF